MRQQRDVGNQREAGESSEIGEENIGLQKVQGKEHHSDKKGNQGGSRHQMGKEI